MRARARGTAERKTRIAFCAAPHAKYASSILHVNPGALHVHAYARARAILFAKHRFHPIKRENGGRLRWKKASRPASGMQFFYVASLATGEEEGEGRRRRDGDGSMHKQTCW